MKLSKLNLRQTITFLTISSLVGCAGTKNESITRTEYVDRPVYVSVPLVKPVKPEIPKIPGKDLTCISTETKDQLINRDVIIKNYIADLEAVIDSTHKK